MGSKYGVLYKQNDEYYTFFLLLIAWHANVKDD